MGKKIRVFLADDTLIAREGWKKILETAEDIEVIGEAETAAETVQMVTNLDPDVLLMDLDWFGDQTAGWSAINEIKQAHNVKVKIIAITAFENLIRDARRVGADSALMKMFTREQLLSEIRTQASKANNSIDVPTLLKSKDLLTDRELEVLRLVAEGHRDKEIAERLFIAPSTAKNFVKKILGKLDAKSRTQAVSKARKLGLIQ